VHQLLGEPGEVPVREVDEAVVTLSAQYLETRLDERDGVTVLVIGDSAVEIEISDEIGSRSRAARALKQLAMTALARAEMLLAEGESALAATERRNRGET
jgi:hypothetical protein